MEYPFEDIVAVGTSFHQEAVSTLFERHGKPLGGALWTQVRVTAEPENEHDENAVAIVVENVRIAYLSRKDNVRLIDYINNVESFGNVILVPAKLWAIEATDERGGWICRITLDPTEPQRELTYVDETHWPGPEVNHGEFCRTPQAINNWITGAMQFGFYRGLFFDWHRERAMSLIDGGQFGEATELLSGCAAASIRYARYIEERPESWPTERLAMILRKRRLFADEVRALEDYLGATPPAQRTKRMRDRLRRAYELAGHFPRHQLIEAYEQPIATPNWEPLCDPLPLRDIPIHEDSIVWNQDQYAHVLHKLLSDNSIAPGNDYTTVATLREDCATGAILVFVGGWRIGHVSGDFSADIRPRLRVASKRGFDGAARCAVAIIKKRRTVTLLSANDIAQVR